MKTQLIQAPAEQERLREFIDDRIRKMQVEAAGRDRSGAGQLGNFTAIATLIDASLVLLGELPGCCRTVSDVEM